MLMKTIQFEMKLPTVKNISILQYSHFYDKLLLICFLLLCMWRGIIAKDAFWDGIANKSIVRLNENHNRPQSVFYVITTMF